MNTEFESEDLEDVRAAQIAQSMTVEQQNYKYSIEARDRTILKLRKEPVRAKALETVVPEVSVANDVVPPQIRRGRGLYGMHARRNRQVG